MYPDSSVPLLVEGGRSSILNNKAIVSQNGFMLKCARRSITNQYRQEIKNSDWLWGGGGYVVSYWGVLAERSEFLNPYSLFN